ncbi:hypothetical protein EDC01DRAFT_634616 [Geopyxis carbonaria]|nr:hypothetical protein EDC01DRAFT_634616 [Geopyxis carbonaria]
MASHGISRTEYAQRSRDQQSRNRELQKLKAYNALVAELQQQVEVPQTWMECSAGDYSSTSLQITSDVLKLNPEFYTVWNYRRQILLHISFRKTPPNSEPIENSEVKNDIVEDPAVQESQFVALLKGELSFLVPLLTTYPKCYWIWNHRLWTLQQSSVLLSPTKSLSFWKAELELVGMMLGRDMRNFHAWMYRRLVVSNIESPVQGEQRSLVKEEYEYTSRVVRGVGGMTNYSAWHQRSTLIPKLLKERGCDTQERMDFLEDELELLKRAIVTDPEDQSLWFYHRWLVYSNTSPGNETAIAPGMSVSTRILILEEQIDQLKGLLEGHPNCKYILKALVSYVQLLGSLRKEPPDEDFEETDGVDESAEAQEMMAWVQHLTTIDPKRRGRYKALGLSEFFLEIKFLANSRSARNSPYKIIVELEQANICYTAFMVVQEP